MKMLIGIFAAAIITVAAPLRALALDVNDVIRAGAIAAAVNEAAEPLDDFINKILSNKDVAAGVETKVVPTLSIGEKAYVGAAQVTGTADRVKAVEAVYQYDVVFQNGKYRIKLVFPSKDINPLNFSRAAGVGVSAMIDLGVSGEAPKIISGGIDEGDLLRGAVVGVLINETADVLNKFINDLYRQKDIGTDYATKVVPYISFGERAYIGGMQVTGTADAVAKVKAVWQIEENFDNGRCRVKALVPSDSINPLKLTRVRGVGVSAVVDTTVATSVKAEKDKAGTGSSKTGSETADRSGAGGAEADAAWAKIKEVQDYINATKKEIDREKKGGKGKGKGKHKDDNDDDDDEHEKGGSSAANKRLADARKTLAQARHAHAQGDYKEAIRLAEEARKIADSAKKL